MLGKCKHNCITKNFLVNVKPDFFTKKISTIETRRKWHSWKLAIRTVGELANIACRMEETALVVAD
jgi:hypothetical protein